MGRETGAACDLALQLCPQGHRPAPVGFNEEQRAVQSPLPSSPVQGQQSPGSTSRVRPGCVREALTSGTSPSAPMTRGSFHMARAETVRSAKPRGRSLAVYGKQEPALVSYPGVPALDPDLKHPVFRTSVKYASEPLCEHTRFWVQVMENTPLVA